MAERTRNRLLTVSKRRSIPPTNLLLASYDRFADGLPAIAANAHLDVSTVIHRELERPPPAWVERERSAGGPG